jgi:hypothetical protein
VSGIRLLNLTVDHNTVNGLEALFAHDVLVEGGSWVANGTTGGGGQAMIFRSTVTPPVRIAHARTSGNGVVGNGVGGITIAGVDATIEDHTSDDDVGGVVINGASNVTLSGAYVGRTHAATWAAVDVSGTALVDIPSVRVTYVAASAYTSTAYRFLDQVVTSSKVYELQVSGCTAGATAPSATSGIQVMADGCAWLYRGASTQSIRYAVRSGTGTTVDVHSAIFKAVSGAYNTDTTESIGFFANGGTVHYADPWMRGTSGLDYLLFNGGGPASGTNESTGLKYLQ